ncbi:S8 family serine peptidase [Apibacter raozihei]|uniref:S8 family serine peptidase n=1 Tax=Apibacter raozihei TaxID=2500547 RepID=UPI000FE38B6A|nr:S8 family serine peptidase [Apibacter raozihei]
MKRKLLTIISVFSVILLSAQTTEQKKKMTKSYDYNKIEKVKKELILQNNLRQKTLNNYLNKFKVLPFSNDEAQGKLAVGINPDGSLVYIGTFNEGSAKTIGARNVNLNLGLNGEGLYAGVWDSGLIRRSHIEFVTQGGSSRIELGTDSITALSSHSTHVGGTIAAAGVSPANTIKSVTYPAGYSKGMAPKALIKSYDFTNDLSEMMVFGTNGYLVSNHSYGITLIVNGKPYYGANWWGLGAYDYTSYKIDQIAHLNKYYQMVFAAGNDRNYGSQLNTVNPGYELVTTYGVAKNVLTVAAVYEQLNYTGASSVTMSTFSNYGPTDDSRIKPNISAKGVSVFSTNSTGDSNYYIDQGTSMATPAITGSILLLQEHYKNLNSKFMLSATVRGLIQHTAREAGSYDGPDYSFGWGLADIESAALAITNNTQGSLIEENKLENQKTYTKKIESSGSTPLQVSISWTDPEFTTYNGDILGYSNEGVSIIGEKDPSGAKYLVNDIDVKVDKIDKDGNVLQTYYPWRLNGKAPAEAAKNDTTNDVDNFERIDISNPDGEYLVTVSHKGSLSGSGQEYSLIITGPDMKTLNAEDIDLKEITTKIYPIPAKNQVFVVLNEKAKYTLFEMTGKILSSGNFVQGTNVLNTSSLPTGTYLVKIDYGNKIETKKIIVQ